MQVLILNTDSYFDGTRCHTSGPYSIEILDGIIRDIGRGRVVAEPASGATILDVPFVMPGLTEAHSHLFLDGAELDVQVRKEYLGADHEQMMDVGQRNVAASQAAGITLVRDAGDRHGVNHELRELVATGTSGALEIRSPGKAIRKAGRYGSFMAAEVTDRASIVETIHALAPTADDLKILLTGIIDFEKGQMKGGVQFDLEETRLIVATARELGLLTYAHCSGPEGLAIAVEAGIDSIEHGFFMERSKLEVMCDKGIAWVPTFSPVYFQYERPELAGWDETTVAGLASILDHHFEYVALACEMGVPVVAGSDAGSYGVPHGTGLVDELIFQQRAGMPLDEVLASATSAPRRLWGCRSADVTIGNAANLIGLAGSPAEDVQNLHRVGMMAVNGTVSLLPEPETTPVEFIAAPAPLVRDELSQSHALFNQKQPSTAARAAADSVHCDH